MERNITRNLTDKNEDHITDDNDNSPAVEIWLISDFFFFFFIGLVLISYMTKYRPSLGAAPQHNIRPSQVDIPSVSGRLNQDRIQ